MQENASFDLEQEMSLSVDYTEKWSYYHTYEIGTLAVTLISSYYSNFFSFGIGMVFTQSMLLILGIG